LAEYLKENYKRIVSVKIGHGYKNRLKLLKAVLLEFTPGHVRKCFPYADNTIQKCVDRSFCNVVLQFNGIAYPIPDKSSVQIICGESEEFMDQYFTPKEGEVVLDIGANIGKYTFSSAKAVGKNGQVIAVEPSNSNCLSIKRGIQLNKFSNVLLYNGAAYSQNCEKNLFIGANNSTNSLIANHDRGTVKVTCRTIDNILENLRWPTTKRAVDWVKIDVEGAEFDVLQGMSKTLKESNPKMIIEVWDFNKAQVDMFLSENGYNFKEISRINFNAERIGTYYYYYCWKK
jgi:FkbM family methyltransferase